MVLREDHRTSTIPNNHQGECLDIGSTYPHLYWQSAVLLLYILNLIISLVGADAR